MARAVLIAAQRGIRVPIVYNTNAYDAVSVLKLLDGIVDIYLPDLKWRGGSRLPLFQSEGLQKYLRLAIPKCFIRQARS